MSSVRRSLRLLGDGARATLVPWVVARVVVAVAYEAATYHNRHGNPLNARGAAQTFNGLLAFDAGWYRSIAEFGYGPASSESLRFFPLYPLSVRGFHLLVPVSWSLASVIVANVASFVAAMALYVLVSRDLRNQKLATRSVWLLCLGPASFVLVFGYAEGLFLALVLLAFVFFRRQSFWWAALFALLAGATRPTGVVLIVPFVVDVVLRWRASHRAPRVGAVAAIVAPLLGMGAFCAWAAHAYGDFFAPLSIQRSSSLHGGLSDPIVVVGRALTNVVHGHHVGTALHVPWIVLSVVLIVVAFRKLPAAYGAFATAMVLVALSGSNLDSFERYALAAFPLTIAASTWLMSKRVAVVVLVLSGISMGVYCFLALQGAYIP